MLNAGAAWLLTYLVHSTVSLMLAMVLPLRQWSLGQRERLWRMALFGPVATASIARFDWTNALRTPPVQLPETLLGSVQAAPHIGPGAVLLVAALGIMTIGVLRCAALVRNHRRFQRQLADRVPVTDAELRAWLAHCGASSVALTRSPALRSPIALAREVCLPQCALGALSRDELRGVLAHEVAHIRRHDNIWRWTALVLERVLAFQPLNRRAVRELHRLSECACDDWAVFVTGNASALASALTKVASWVEPRPQAALVAMAGEESLSLTRVRRLLVRDRPMCVHPPSRLFRATTALLLGSGVTLPSFQFVSPTTSSGTETAMPSVLVTASDPAGRFTVALQRGRAVAVTINDVPIARDRIHQTGRRIVVSDASALTRLDLTVHPDGDGIAWSPRSVPPGIH